MHAVKTYFKDLQLLESSRSIDDLSQERRACPCGDGEIVIEVEDYDHSLRVDMRCARCADEWRALTRQEDGSPVNVRDLMLVRQSHDVAV